MISDRRCVKHRDQQVETVRGRLLQLLQCTDGLCIDPMYAGDSPSRAGVYGIFVKDGVELPHLEVPRGRLLYLGMSGNLHRRAYQTHFKSGQTGFSTVRRSLGAVLKEHLDLVAIPRGREVTDTNCNHYEFAGDGEKILSDWMSDNLRFHFQSMDENVRQRERELIELYGPVLCLRGWPNPQAGAIGELRAVCVAEARGLGSTGSRY